MPNDGGHLIWNPVARRELLTSFPSAERFVRKFVGADDLLNGHERYVLWITDDVRSEADKVPVISERVHKVAAYRLDSRRDATRKLAAVPYRFGEVRHRESTAIIVPRHSSENRDYIPIGFLGPDTIISDAANAIYGAEPWLLAVLTSRMHNVWVRAVGGRLKTDFRYSATLCYNTFPVPPLSEKSRELLTERAFAVLDVREQHSDKTLAQLYDPDKMPTELREAHQFLDAAVDQRNYSGPSGGA
jgi:hypothetical protein